MSDKFRVLKAVRGVEALAPLLEVLSPAQIGIDYVIAGGFARYCVSTKVNPFAAADIDLFATGPEASRVLIEKLRAFGLQTKRENAIAVTFEKCEAWPDVLPVQVIKPIRNGSVITYGTLETIVDKFDFTIARCALFSVDEALVDIDFVEDEEQNNLQIRNITCPVSAIMRSMKYARKGYFLRPIESFKIFADWDKRSSTYKARIFELFRTMEKNGLTVAEIDELELLLLMGENAITKVEPVETVDRDDSIDVHALSNQELIDRARAIISEDDIPF